MKNENTQKFNIVLPENFKAEQPLEIIVREGEAAAVLDPKEPEIIIIRGNIDTPFRWLEKRVSEASQVDQKFCHVLVDRDIIGIELIIDERNYYKSKIMGSLDIHLIFRKFGINTDRTWKPNELGQFFKMNRSFFADKAKNMEIVSILKNFTARVSQSIEKSREDNGSYADNFSAVVDSNLPKSFSLNIPIFKGCPAETLEVELYASIDGRDVSLSLISPGASELYEDYRDRCIDDVLNRIKEIAPDIVIIEK